MSSDAETAATAPASALASDPKPQAAGLRKNGRSSPTPQMQTRCRWLTTMSPGKQWHQQKKAFRPNAGLTSYAKRAEERKALAAVKAKEKEMKDEKEAERQVRWSRT